MLFNNNKNFMMNSKKDDNTTIINEVIRSNNTTTNSCCPPPDVIKCEIGINGVSLKHYEKVIKLLLEQQFIPQYSILPPIPSSFNKNENYIKHNNIVDKNNNNNDNECNHKNVDNIIWPYHLLPSAARVYGNLPGQLSELDRAIRKEQQVVSILRCIYPFLISNNKDNNSTKTIIDFGGGSGHVSITLALLFPSCKIICVDLGKHSLKLLHQKALQCTIDCSTTQCSNNKESLLGDLLIEQQCQQTAIPNLYTYYGSADTFQNVETSFDIAIALHLCGEATDVVLRMAGTVNAEAIIVAPCCVGKLSNNNKNPYIYHATGQNIPTIQYPQSILFCQYIKEQYDWNSLAQAADYSSINEEIKTNRNAARRTAKALLEFDRCQFLQETFHYQTVMVRMEPWDATPKNDIIIAWKNNMQQSSEFPLNLEIDKDCQADIQLTINHLLEQTSVTNDMAISNKNEEILLNDTVVDGSNSNNNNNKNDWTKEEEDDIRQQLTRFLMDEENNNTYCFPKQMGKRKRKIIHYVAETMGLVHWGVGKKNSDKTVAVARRRQKSSVLGPVVRSSLENNIIITDADIETYQNDGVIVLRNVLSKKELEILEQGIEYNIQHPGPLAGIASLHTDPGKFFEDFCNWSNVQQYEHIMRNSYLPYIASKLTNSNTIRIYHDHVLVKEPKTIQVTPWHQDQPYYNISGRQNVSFWIPIDPVPKESSLQFVPCSHKGESWYMPRTFLSKEAKWFTEGSLPEVPVIDKLNIISWSLQPGDVVAFHMLSLHGSMGSKDRRRVFSARYIGDDIRHAPRSWRTSPEFPSSLKDEIPDGAELDHPLFPVVYENN